MAAGDSVSTVAVLAQNDVWATVRVAAQPPTGAALSIDTPRISEFPITNTARPPASGTDARAVRRARLAPGGMPPAVVTLNAQMVALRPVLRWPTVT